VSVKDSAAKKLDPGDDDRGAPDHLGQLPKGPEVIASLFGRLAANEFFVPSRGQNRGQNPFTYSPRMAKILEFFNRPMEPRVGFELSVRDLVFERLEG
jgi:hypothetical protein